MTTAETFLRAGAILAEGVVWSAEDETLLWVDILRHEVHRTAADGSADEVTPFDGPVGNVGLADHGLVVGGRKGLHRIDPAAGNPLLVAYPCDMSDLRSNDGKPGPDGRYYLGTMGYPAPRPGTGALWRTDGRTMEQLVDGVTISNGLGWSPDHSTMYYIDTPTGRVDAFDFDVATGAVDARRTVVQIDRTIGGPDGMTVDADGRLWVAVWGASAVHCYEDGRLVDRIDLPTPQVSCVTFGGPQLDRLYITTANEDGDLPPGAGDLYVAEPGVRGLPPFRFRLPDDAPA